MKNLELNDKAVDDVRKTVVYKRCLNNILGITMCLNKKRLKICCKKLTD